MKRRTSHRVVHTNKKAQKAKARKKKEHVKDLFHDFDPMRDLDTIISKQKTFQDFLGFSKENIPPLCEQAASLLNVGRTEEAISAFSLLTKINPYLPDCWVGLGLSYMAQEQFKEAIEALVMAITLDATYPELYEYLVDCCLELHEEAQARAFVEEAKWQAKKHHLSELLFAAKKLEEKIAEKTTYSSH